MQNYKEINGNDYVKDSRTTINETMRSIQSMNSGTVFPTTNLFEGMKCYRTDLKKTYTLTDVENNTWAEDDIASKLSTARKINITGNATGAATFDGTGDANISVSVSQAAHADNADNATTASMLQTTDGTGAIEAGKFYWVGKDGQPTWLWGSNTKPSETYVYNPSNFHVSAANNDGNGANIANTYLKRSGGTMAGALNFANATWNLVGDDSYMGDHNISGTFCVKGANGETGIALCNNANEADYARISYGGGNINFNKTIGGNITGNAGSATTSARVIGYYTGNGGQQGPGYFGKERAGCLMSNAIVRGHSEYKNWLYMDNYSGTDVGGATAIGVSREQMRAYIMRSNADRATWNDSAELLSSANYNEFAPTKTGAGASGTWPISISGSADTVDGYHASDIINSITAANTGGIVAASLTENGYVKFANGLILQWGKVVGPEIDDFNWVTTTFPIAFTSACFSALCCDEIIYSFSNTDCAVRNLQKTSVDIGFYSSDMGKNVRWMAIGV